MQPPSRRFSRLTPASSDSPLLSGYHARPHETVFPPLVNGLCLCGTLPLFYHGSPDGWGLCAAHAAHRPGADPIPPHA